MGLREIKKALKFIEQEGSEKDLKKLILLVPAKRGKVADRKEVLEAIERGDGEEQAEHVKALFKSKDAGIGVYTLATSVEYGLSEGDLVAVQYDRDGKTPFTAYHTGEVVIFRFDDLDWSRAVAVDENLESIDPVERAHQIVYGVPQRRRY